MMEPTTIEDGDIMTITHDPMPRIAPPRPRFRPASTRPLDRSHRGRRSDELRRPLAPAFRAMRPRQWVKNGLVFAAPFAAGTLLTGSVSAHAALAAAAMCAAASTTYLLNDVADRDRDRRHPTKCHRPIASGDLSVGAASVLAVAAALAALVVAAVLSPLTAALVAGYLAMTISYSRRLKHIAHVELAVVAAGFVLRVLIGASATATPLSPAFLIVVGAGALFLAIAKRFAELHELGAAAVQHRPVLAHYSLDGLGCGMVTTLGFAVLSYVVWAFGAEPLTIGSPWLAVSILPVAVAAGRVYRRAAAGAVGDPTEVVLGDRVLQLAGAAALATLLVGLYVL